MELLNLKFRKEEKTNDWKDVALARVLEIATSTEQMDWLKQAYQDLDNGKHMAVFFTQQMGFFILLIAE